MFQLLWTNPNPNSAMGATTITLSQNVSNFKMLLIVFRPEYVQTNGYCSAIMPVDVGQITLQGIKATYDSTKPSGLDLYRRMNVIGSNQVSANRGWYCESNKNPTEYTGACVPEYIYGLN